MGTESSSHVIRDQLYSVLRSVAQTEPGLVNQLITDALVAFVSREEKPSAKPVAEDTERPVDYQIRLSSILSASSALPTDTDLEVRKQILTNLVALAHHKRICKPLRYTYIHLIFTVTLQRDLLSFFGSRFARGRTWTPANLSNQSWMIY